MAVVLPLLLLLVVGVWELGRIIQVQAVLNNAARDAARYAAVRVSCPPDQVAATRQAVLDYATARMGGVQRQIDGYRVAVYAVDPAGLDLTPAVVRPKSLRPPAYPDPFDPLDPNAVPWNSVAFTERVAVTVTGTYRPLLPAFLFMPRAIPVTVTAIMGGEG
jgi:Flp pilus assembly protein TadG